MAGRKGVVANVQIWGQCEHFLEKAIDYRICVTILGVSLLKMQWRGWAKRKETLQLGSR